MVPCWQSRSLLRGLFASSMVTGRRFLRCCAWRRLLWWNAVCMRRWQPVHRQLLLVPGQAAHFLATRIHGVVTAANNEIRNISAADRAGRLCLRGLPEGRGSAKRRRVLHRNPRRRLAVFAGIGRVLPELCRSAARAEAPDMDATLVGGIAWRFTDGQNAHPALGLTPATFPRNSVMPCR